MGCKTRVPLSRQPADRMTRFVRRRKRWWTTVEKLDDKLEMSAEMLAEWLLESSGLCDSQQLVIVTSVANERDFEEIADALIKRHPRIQSETRSERHGKGDHDNHKPNRRTIGEGGGKTWGRKAHYGEDGKAPQ